MKGTIIFRDVFGVSHRMENEEHAKFMALLENLENNTPILLSLKDRHMFLNPRHVVVIEWLFS